jgi:T5SS/PEP-CTERM-associated repeat protein
LFVGRYGNGKLSVLDGGTVDVRNFNLGFGNGSEGIATVRGPNSSLASSYLFEVGERGEGVLRIEDGASLTTNHSAIGYYSKGTVYVSGKGSTWDVQSETFLIGRNLNSQGAVHIEDGGQLSSRYGHIGQFGNSTGTVTVSGTDSEWRISRTLTVGNQGVGTLEIRGGAYVLNRMGRVAYDSSASGVVVVSGAGSVWDSASLHLGGRGSGELLIEDAARVFSSSQSTIAGGAESSGIVKVTGIGSSWTAYRLTVGYFGHGQLLIENGGLVEAQSTFTIDLDGDGDSHIRMKSGGMLAILGSASESLDDFLNLIEGTDAIEYWNGAQWDHILNAAAGVDFTLEHISSGKLEGYTVLTVGTVVPEPTSLMLVGVGLVAMVAKRSR